MIEVAPDDVITSKLDGKGRVTIPKDVRDEWRADAGDRVEVAVVGTDASGYQCDECGERFPLPQVLHSDERTVCGECAGVDGRMTVD